MNLKEFIQTEIKSQMSESKDMTFVDYLKVLDAKFLDAMKAVRGDNGSDAAITPTRGDILQNFTLFRNYLSALTKKYKGDKTKLRFISEHTNKFNETIESVVNEAKKKLPNFKKIPSWAKYVAQSSDGEWTWYEDTPTMIKFKDGSGGAWKQDGNQTYTGVKTNGKDWDKIPTYYNVKNGVITESINEEQIDEKSRLKKEASFRPNSGTMSGGTHNLDNRKYKLNRDVTGVRIGDYVGITLPKGTIIYNISGGLFADHISLKKYADRNRIYFNKPTFKGISITREKSTLNSIETNSKILESIVNEGDDFNMVSAKFKDALDDASSLSTKSVKLLIKKFKEESPKAAMDYAKQEFGWMMKEGSSKFKESVTNEEQIDEKLITFSNRAPYGQIVFMAGGAGSGKGFAIDNFIDSAGFKVRDVDDMKKAVGKLNQLGKFSVDKWYKKYGKTLSDKSKGNGLSPKAHVEEFVLGKGMSISDISKDLKNPNNVASLHYIVDSMGLKDKWLINMLSGKTNKETLPNLLFDITAKKVSSITDVIKPLIANGYDSKNVHLIWVLKNYHAAVEANKERARVVPSDILLQTHEGASKTMWQVLTQIKPKGLNGRIDVILNNNKFTATFVDSNGKEIQVEPNQMNKLKKAQPVVSGFKSLPIKKQGGGVIPETQWQGILKGWILSNTPNTIDFEELEEPPKDKE